jgi:hypothetical protein
MKNTRSFCLRVSAILVALTVGLSAYAETPREEVVHAYHLLEKADRDYDGHRGIAMEQVRAAGKDIGLELNGEIPDRERQWKSDKQLEEARRLLKHAREKLEARDRDHAAEHLDKAIHELDIALKLK